MPGLPTPGRLWDIEGRLVDTKAYPFENSFRGETRRRALHEMWLRLTVDDALLVRDVVAVTDAGPYAVCGRSRRRSRS